MRTRRVLTWMVGLCCLAIGGPATAPAAKPVQLDPQGRAPTVAVDERGTAHIAWHTPDANFALRFCRLAAGSAACAARDLGVPSVNQQVMLAEPGHVFVMSHRSNPSRLLESVDGGETFRPPVELGPFGELKHQFILGLGSQVLAVGGEVCSSPNVSGCVTFQAVPTAGGSTTRTRLNYDGPQSETTFSSPIGLDEGGVPVVVWGTPDGFAWRAWSGQGDVNDAASWLPAQSLAYRARNLHLLSGPKGLFLFGEGPDGRSFLSRYDKARNTFLSGVPTPIQRGQTEAWQDLGGILHLVQWSDAAHLYSVSTDGGATFTDPVELVDRGESVPGGLDRLEGASSSNGSGYLVFNRLNSTGVFALELPPVSTLGGPPPTIQLSVRPRSARARVRTRFRFRATYRRGAEQLPVAQARVTFGGRSAVTGADGRMTMTRRFARPRRLTARACKDEFVCGTAVVRIRRR